MNRISHGTIASNTSAGSASSSTAPATAPTAQVASTAVVVRGCSRSSRRYPHDPLSAPGVRPTVLEAFATTGGSPTASSTGKLSSDATPTVEVKIPAPNPAASTASYSRPLIPSP